MSPSSSTPQLVSSIKIPEPCNCLVSLEGLSDSSLPDQLALVGCYRHEDGSYSGSLHVVKVISAALPNTSSSQSSLPSHSIHHVHSLPLRQYGVFDLVAIDNANTTNDDSSNDISTTLEQLLVRSGSHLDPQLPPPQQQPTTSVSNTSCSLLIAAPCTDGWARVFKVTRTGTSNTAYSASSEINTNGISDSYAIHCVVEIPVSSEMLTALTVFSSSSNSCSGATDINERTCDQSYPTSPTLWLFASAHGGSLHLLNLTSTTTEGIREREEEPNDCSDRTYTLHSTSNTRRRDWAGHEYDSWCVAVDPSMNSVPSHSNDVSNGIRYLVWSGGDDGSLVCWDVTKDIASTPSRHDSDDDGEKRFTKAPIAAHRKCFDAGIVTIVPFQTVEAPPTKAQQNQQTENTATRRNCLLVGSYDETLYYYDVSTYAPTLKLVEIARISVGGGVWRVRRPFSPCAVTDKYISKHHIAPTMRIENVNRTNDGESSSRPMAVVAAAMQRGAVVINVPLLAVDSPTIEQEKEQVVHFHDMAIKTENDDAKTQQNSADKGEPLVYDVLPLAACNGNKSSRYVLTASFYDRDVALFQL